MHQFTRTININKLILQLLPRAPYSLDFAPSDYFLFSDLKKNGMVEKFANNEQVELAVDGYFEELNDSHYEQGIKSIEYLGKCIELN